MRHGRHDPAPFDQTHRHRNSLCLGSDLICIGTLRDAEPSRFYDVITIMERDDTEPVQRAQGDALAKACATYIKSECADTDGIPVLPFEEKDYVPRLLVGS